MSRFYSLLTVLFCCLLAPLSAHGSIVFSNTFEDGNITPDLGTWAFGNTSTNSFVGVSSASPDPTLGTTVGLIDQGTGNLDLDLNFADANNSFACLDLTNGNTVNLSFDVAARRTNGAAKTTRIQALDIGGNIVMEFVLGDNNAFTNGAADRQRPGYDTSTAPAVAFGSSFYWGADTSPATFDVTKDAHFDLTIGASGWDLSGDGQNANEPAFTQTNLPTWDGSTFTNIASFNISSDGTGYGLYWDNIVIDATAPVIDGASHVPEPGSALLLTIATLGFVVRRRR